MQDLLKRMKTLLPLMTMMEELVPVLPPDKIPEISALGAGPRCAQRRRMGAP